MIFHVKILRFLRLWLASAFLLTLTLTGCATSPKPSTPSYSPPNYTKAWQAVSQAQEEARNIQSVLPPELQPRVAEIRKTLSSAQSEIASYVSQVSIQTEKLNAATVEKNAALAESEKWHAKQEKGLREIWFWRLIILTEIGCMVGWLALRGGLKAFMA